MKDRSTDQGVNGLLVSTVPLDFDVSGVPSPFTDLFGLLVRSIEYFVSLFDIPSCFPDIEARPPGGFDAATYKEAF